MNYNKAPFPWFGGKSRVAGEVWARFGRVDRYIEPFAGSLAVLLARPRPFTGSEVVNDVNGLLVNFWRATAADSAAVAAHADIPVGELELRSRCIWARSIEGDIAEALASDPEWYDAKAAGWWVWAQCAAVLGNFPGSPGGRPDLGPRRGVLAGAGRLESLGDRMRDVVALCGDWSRLVCSDSALGLTQGSTAGIFLDPPYGLSAQRSMGCYGEHDSGTVAEDVLGWCIDHGRDQRLRIALCGYDVEHSALEGRGWSVFSWKSSGNFNGSASSANASRERIWFSPHCQQPAQASFGF